MKNPIVTISKVGLLGLALSFSAGSALEAQVAFFDDFGSYGENANLIGDGWTFKSANAANTAVVKEAGTHTTVTAFGNGDRLNARLSPTNTEFSEVTVSDTENNHLAADIRWTSPETSGNLTLTYFNAQASGGIGNFNMGLIVSGGANGFFIDFGGSGATKRLINTEIDVDPSAWYRFDAVFTPSIGLVEFEVLKLGDTGPETVWIGSNLGEGLDAYFATTWAAIEVDVSRPNNNPLSQTSSDFDNIMVSSIPEPATTAALLGAGCLALLGYRRIRRSGNS